MIAALHSSRPGGTKKFEIGGCNFGWKALEELFLREVERARTNQLRRVPDLKESHIYRDCWTRLNVKPAKIMQVNGYLSVFRFEGGRCPGIPPYEQYQVSSPTCIIILETTIHSYACI